MSDMKTEEGTTPHLLNKGWSDGEDWDKYTLKLAKSKVTARKLQGEHLTAPRLVTAHEKTNKVAIKGIKIIILKEANRKWWRE